MRRRVVISGIGALTPVGQGVEGLWSGVRAGLSAVRPISRFDASSFRSRVAAQINDFEPFDHMDARTVRRLDRFAQFGVAAARLSLADANLDVSSLIPDRAGIAIGSALGGIAYAEEQHRRFLRDGIRSVSPTLALAVYGGASAGNIAIDLNLRGPNMANANSCASGAMAVGDAFRAIQHDDADVMIAGGVEAPLAPLTFGAFSLIKAMSARNDDAMTASRPFDVNRDGFVMGEGAALLVLEELRHARLRGARVYAEVKGYGQSNDAYHMTAPRPDGSQAARAIVGALADAQSLPESVGYINAHATGTELGDAAEVRALCTALGCAASVTPVSGTKGLYGHALGASGAIEIAITALALQRGFLPGNVNLKTVDPDFFLNFLPVEGVSRRVGRAISTSFGFGGTNAALVLDEFDENRSP